MHGGRVSKIIAFNKPTGSDDEFKQRFFGLGHARGLGLGFLPPERLHKAGLLVILFYFRKYNLYRIILICFLLLRNHDLAIRSTHNITPL